MLPTTARPAAARTPLTVVSLNQQSATRIRASEQSDKTERVPDVRLCDYDKRLVVAVSATPWAMQFLGCRPVEARYAGESGAAALRAVGLHLDGSGQLRVANNASFISRELAAQQLGAVCTAQRGMAESVASLMQQLDEQRATAEAARGAYDEAVVALQSEHKAAIEASEASHAAELATGVESARAELERLQHDLDAACEQAARRGTSFKAFRSAQAKHAGTCGRLAVAQQERDEARGDAEAAQAETAAAKTLQERYRGRSRRARKLAQRLQETLPLTSEWSKQFEALLRGQAPPEQAGLRDLWEDQLKCLASKRHYCRWHPRVLSWCADVWRRNRGAYEQMAFGDVLILPHPDTIRKHVARDVAHPGHDMARYEALGPEGATKGWSESEREFILKFDEINISSGLAWRKVGGKYEFHGLAPPSTLDAVYPGIRKEGATAAEGIAASLATHALVFQITSTGRGGKKLQRVVGVHAVRDCPADRLHELFTETIEHLATRSKITVVAAVCDGASTNRLLIKMNTAHDGRGSPNHYKRCWCRNPAMPWLKLFFISDPAHCLKKPANNWETSHVGESGKRGMWLTSVHVEAILSQVKQAGADAHKAGTQQQVPGSIGELAAQTRGEEAYIYVFGRIYEHLTDHKPYMAKSIEQLEKDRRVVELRFLLKWLRTWHTHNAAVNVGEEKSTEERARWGLSHQLFFDVQLEIEGTLDLLRDQVERHGSVCLCARRLSQDSLESLFGQLRFACGGGNHPELLKVTSGARAAEESNDAKRRVSGQRKRKRNSGREDESRTTMASWEAERATTKRTAAAAAIAEVAGPRRKLQRWHMKEPHDFDAQLQAQLQPGARIKCNPVSWATMKRIQEWDAEHNFGARVFHKLTPAHFDRKGPLKMNMGIVIDIFSRTTARGLRYLRSEFAS